MNAYICSCCGYLVIFRNWNGRRHHPIHLPTGWPCWRMQENGECTSPEPLPFPVGQPTAPARWRRTIDEGVELYRGYRRQGDMKGLRGLFGRELRAGRVDVVRDLLEEILDRFANTAELRSLIQQVVVSDEWLALAERARQASC